DVPTHVLRFWEVKFPSIKPLKRGGGRRYYRPEDVELLRRIRRLLYEEGYTIKGAQRLVRESGARSAGEAATDAEGAVGQSGNGHARPFGPDLRRELNEILDELRELRSLLDRTRT